MKIKSGEKHFPKYRYQGIDETIILKIALDLRISFM